MDYVLYTFSSSAQAMKSEIVLEENKIQGRLVPLLPEIDAGCGLALRFGIEDYKIVEDLFLDKNLGYQGRYIISYDESSIKPKVREYDLS